MYCVSVAPPLSAVKRVLTTFFANLNIDLFFSVSLSLATCGNSLDTSLIPSASTPVASSTPSNNIVSSASALVESVPFKAIAPSSPVALSSTKSAVKSWPLSASFINTDRTSLKENEEISLIVRSTFPPLSIMPPVSAESEAVTFSPELNVPITFVKLINSLEVPLANTEPVAPEVTPLI